MFSKLSVVVLSVLMTLAAAMPNGYDSYPPPSCSYPETTPSSSATTPTSSAITPTSPATTPTSSAITPTSPVTTPTSSAITPTSPATTPTSPATPPTSPQCCHSVLSSTDGAVSAVAALLGLDLTGLNVPIGLGCSPITVIGNNCGSTTVNCEAPKEQWGSLIAINCIPITL
ncbi:hypothetical protein B0H13DRAFT_2478507 [Mycena leptocephala]|nr:hypothetical protein B0H13DRAFT_2478507 [Mycena leptocephala]